MFFVNPFCQLAFVLFMLFMKGKLVINIFRSSNHDSQCNHDNSYQSMNLGKSGNSSQSMFRGNSQSNFHSSYLNILQNNCIGIQKEFP